jgi:hypothetical protein
MRVSKATISSKVGDFSRRMNISRGKKKQSKRYLGRVFLAATVA